MLIVDPERDKLKDFDDKLLHFDQVGVDAILSVVPYYNKPSQEGIYQHFKTLAKISPLPLILYNVPSRTGVNMTAETTLRLAHEFESIVGVKEASGIFSQIDAIIKNKPEGFDVISGDDGITLPMMSLGASGVISVLGNAFPAEMVEMVHASLSGDYIQAFIIHQRLIELFDLLMVDGNPSGIKSMLHFLGRIQNVVRLPLVPARAETSEKIKNAITLLTSGCASC